MAIINTKGVEAFIQVGSSTATDLTPTAITKTNPAEITIESIAGLSVGDVVSFTNTGFAELDGKTFAVGTIDAVDKTFKVLGADTSQSNGALSTSGAKASVVKSLDMVKICLSSIEIGADSVNQVDVSTFCDTSAQTPGKVTPGTITLAGYADTDDTGLAEIIKASEDQQPRSFKINLPGSNNGYIVGKITLAGLSYGVPLEGAMTYTVSGTQTTKIRWVHE
jgi:hypothetical protein